jgi:cobalt-precorrin-5B (C1)-methyltransferase
MRSGYTLPVFATAGAIAALRCLQQSIPIGIGDDRSLAEPLLQRIVTVDLLDPPQQVEIEIEQVAIVQPGMALGITRSDPGDNLDLTRDMPIWTVVEWADVSQVEPVAILGGEGVGKQSNLNNLPAIYSYARRLLQANLAPLLTESQKIRVTIILPEGKILATRTSNQSFGVVEGLSLLGTTGISQPLSAPGQLDLSLSELRSKVATLDLHSPLVFCIGENGLDLAQRMGIERDRIVKTANWLGPLLAEAGLLNVPQLLLFGYHGKLIKLAGGIFHTHHHLADGRLEILVAAAARVGLPAPQLGGLFACETAEAVLGYLGEIDSLEGGIWVKLVYEYLADRIDARSQTYIYSQSQRRVTVGSVLFDRQREIIVASPIGSTLLAQLC